MKTKRVIKALKDLGAETLVNEIKKISETGEYHNKKIIVEYSFGGGFELNFNIEGEETELNERNGFGKFKKIKSTELKHYKNILI